VISEIHWINEEKIGENRIGTMARPRGNDWLDDEIKWLKIRKIDCLVSLLEQSEQWELGLQNEEEICKKWGIEFINFPIKDVNTPKNEEEFIKLAIKLSNQINENKRVVIHCRMGIGRASILAAAIMINLGLEGSEVFEIISIYRKLKVPDTEEQKDWILSIEEKLKKHE
jgi:protein-tyrosine phosphatase